MKNKVDVVVTGRFHAFDLAKQFQKANILGCLYSTYPYYVSKRWIKDRDKYVGYPFLEILNRVKAKIPLISDDWVNATCKSIFSSLVSMKCSSKIVVCWSGSGLEILKNKDPKKIYILERGSTHFTYQNYILQKEHKKLGQDYHTNFHQWQRELVEYELCDFISVPSEFVKHTFISNGVCASKILVNPYGVELDKFLPQPKTDDRFRIVFCGLACVRKGFHYLLEAFSKLEDKGLDCELIHIGAISDDMKHFIEQYKSPNISYLGTFSQDTLSDYYAKGSVFVMPSLEEGVAMVQFQAMSCGLPLICTSNSGGEELITEDGKEGFIVPICDPYAIADKVELLYRDRDLLTKMSMNARARVSNNFTWDDYGKRYLNNIEKILDLAKDEPFVN